MVLKIDVDEAVRVMSANEIMRAAGQPWNRRGAMPLHKWLCEKQSQVDQMRLKCLGNILIPRCAQLAVHQIEHFLRSQA